MKCLTLWVVFVRDLLMNNENFDIDIVVELDATKLAKEFAKETMPISPYMINSNCSCYTQ